MTGTNQVTGHIAQTSPPSSPLDSLKALALRNIDRLEYVVDRLGDTDCGVADDVLDFIDAIKLAQYEALAEHVPVAVDEHLSELRHIHPCGYLYSDGSLVVERFESRYGTSTYFTRYDGPREEALQRHLEWVERVQRDVETETALGELVDGIDWGSHDPSLEQ